MASFKCITETQHQHKHFMPGDPLESTVEKTGKHPCFVRAVKKEDKESGNKKPE